MAAVVTTTTAKINAQVKLEQKMENLIPFTYPKKHGVKMSYDILNQIKGNGSGGKHFKVNLYAASLKPSCRGQPDGKDLPQQNESYYYSAQPVGTKYYFYGPLRKYNKTTGQFECVGAYRTRWHIDSKDWTLNQADYGSTWKWTHDEYRVVLEPFERAWNRAVIDIDENGPVYVNDSLSPRQLSAFRTRITNQEKLDTALLQRKHDNQRKRERAKTPSPTFSKKRRNNILAHTSMQRMFTTAKMKHGNNKLVFVTVGDYYHTYSHDAIKLATYTDLKLENDSNDWNPPQIIFSKDKLDYYRACCLQTGFDVVIV